MCTLLFQELVDVLPLSRIGPDLSCGLPLYSRPIHVRSYTGFSSNCSNICTSSSSLGSLHHPLPLYSRCVCWQLALCGFSPVYKQMWDYALLPLGLNLCIIGSTFIRNFCEVVWIIRWATEPCHLCKYICVYLYTRSPDTVASSANRR